MEVCEEKKCERPNCLACKNRAKGIRTVKFTMLFCCKNHYLGTIYADRDRAKMLYDCTIGNAYVIKLETLDEELTIDTNKILYIDESDDNLKIGKSVAIMNHKNSEKASHFYIIFSENGFCSGLCNKKEVWFTSFDSI